MFKQDGQFRGTILETMIADPKFSKDPDAFDVCLRIQGPNAPDGSEQVDWWHGEVSGKVATMGNLKGKTQSQITGAELAKIGFVGADLSQLDAQLLNKDIDFTVTKREYEGKDYFDLKYLGAPNFGPKKLDQSETARRLAMFAQGAAAQPAAAQPAPAAAPVAPAAAPAAAAGW